MEVKYVGLYVGKRSKRTKLEIHNMETERLGLDIVACNAQIYASDTYSFIRGVGSDTPRYTIWFDTRDDYRKSAIQDHFEAINGNDFSNFTFDCTCNDPDKFAYVYAYSFQSRDYHSGH